MVILEDGSRLLEEGAVGVLIRAELVLSVAWVDVAAAEELAAAGIMFMVSSRAPSFCMNDRFLSS